MQGTIKLMEIDGSLSGIGAVLIVDDEPSILSALRRALRDTPWKILTADSGREGLQVLADDRVAVVIADYQMPDMDGVQFLNRVKQRWPMIQRVMLTGEANLATVEHVVNESEVFRFLNKPWSESQLRATIEECFERICLFEINARYEAELAERNRELERLNRDLERQVEQRTQALLHAEKMAALGRMAGGVAHEINNPLGGVLAFVQLLRKNVDGDPENLESIEAIETCAFRCKSIVDNLLRFSRSPALESASDVDLNEVAEAALGIARLHPRARDVEIEVELEPSLQVVTGRASFLQQVVVNLLQNAFQASERGQDVVLRTLADDDWVSLEVEDSGCGISQDALPRIFEPFYTTKDVGEGTGLGLSICYGIVKEHGGRLDVSSRENVGSVFALRLPVNADRDR